ncbi:MAG: hypothetical protein WD428_02820 [Gaiellaceae bacterium]
MGRGLLGVLVAALVFTAGTATAARPLVTAVHEPSIADFWDQNAVFFDRIVGTGSTAVRIWIEWRDVAPTAPVNPADPADPAYVWVELDREVQAARARGLRVLLTFYEAPKWAERGTAGRQGSNDPDPVQLGLFARAAALRFQGQVFDWEIWNEPNLWFFFEPQLDSAGNSLAPARYRELVNSAAASLHAVDARNRVVAGALAPFGPVGGHMPLDFMRKVLCMSRGKSPKRVCNAKTTFDVWSHHPYTQGGPRHQAYWPDDASMGDLGEIRRLLRAAVRAGNVVHSRPVAFWVTEWSWETSPPDPQGLQPRRHARWTAEALYRMWANGVSFVTWWLLRDRPFPEAVNQSGLYHCGSRSSADEDTCWLSPVAGDAAKPLTIRALRFPFVAFPRSRGLFVWGRTPGSDAARVVIEARISGTWRRLAVLRGNRHGIFTRVLRASAPGKLVRARLAGQSDASVAFRATPTRDVTLAHPFGCGGGLPC